MQSNQKSPSWENIIKETIARGINPLSIIAYGYYGSQATGLATPSSDEDIFIITDVDIRKKDKMSISEESDIKFIPAQEWANNADFLFDIIAIGNIIFPKQIRSEGKPAEYNPWAAYIRNYRPSPYVAMSASASAMRAAERRREDMTNRESYDPISMAKRAKNARKEKERCRKLEEYAYAMLTSSNPTYKPHFNQEERVRVLNNA